jgi:hypothetical protein
MVLLFKLKPANHYMLLAFSASNSISHRKDFYGKIKTKQKVANKNRQIIVSFGKQPQVVEELKVPRNSWLVFLSSINENRVQTKCCLPQPIPTFPLFA